MEALLLSSRVSLASKSVEPILFNLGQVYRKTGDYNNAKNEFQKALHISPKSSSTLVALAYTHHLEGQVDDAVALYHQALGIHPDDSIAIELLNIALEESVKSNDWYLTLVWDTEMCK
jgi:Tfp pilus assembly protein PilF